MAAIRFRAADQMSVIPFEQPGIRGFLHRPERAGERGMVLTHGAGGNCRSPLLIAAAEAFCAEGLVVFRCDLPFRQRRATGPPSPSTAAADREGSAHTPSRRCASLVPGQIFLGGQSYGGRQATMLAADEPEIAVGAPAVLLSAAPARQAGPVADRALSPAARTGGIRPRHQRPVRLDPGDALGGFADPGADRDHPDSGCRA